MPGINCSIPFHMVKQAVEEQQFVRQSFPSYPIIERNIKNVIQKWEKKIQNKSFILMKIIIDIKTLSIEESYVQQVG